MKVKKAALDAMGEMHSQLGPLIQTFVKSKDIQIVSLEKTFSDNPHDTTALKMERKMKCTTLPSEASNSPHQTLSQSRMSSILSVPSIDLVGSLKNDCLTRINTTEGKKSWKLRKEAMEEVQTSLSKCGGLIATEGKALSTLKQLFVALRARLNDSQSNLKPISATLIGQLLNHIDNNTQAKLGKTVYPALINAATNDMKKTMRDAALTSISIGTERPKQGGTNPSSIECFILCLESELSDAALKSAGLPDVLGFLTKTLDAYFLTEPTRTISSDKQLAKIGVSSLLSSKAGTRSAAEMLLSICFKSGAVSTEALKKETEKLLPAQQRSVMSSIPNTSAMTPPEAQETAAPPRQPSKQSRQLVRSLSSRQSSRQKNSVSNQVATVSRHDITADKATDEESENPLHPSTFKPTKLQRLSLLGKSDHWPEYPEEPNGDATLRALRKSWSSLISSKPIDILFPKGGIRSHEDSIKGCAIISRAIEYSRSSKDESLLEQLDLIFKWVACALSSRDHTSGLRSLLSMVQLLFVRLKEIKFTMYEAEATILRE